MKKLLYTFAFLAFASSFLFIRFSDDTKLVNIAIKKGEKVYLLPFIADKESVELDLSGGQTPTISKSVQIVEDHGDLFMEPKDFKRIVNLIADNYILYDRKENTHDGYVGLNEKEIIEYSSKRINTDKIGEQINRQTIVLRKASQSKSHEIVWTEFPEPLAEKNCILKKLWVVEHPYPGETVGDYQNTVVINLKDIVDFYDNGTSLEYDENDEILYVIK